MLFHNLKLDEFQIQACRRIDAGDSVVVSAPTGTGKTVIAEYAIERYASKGMRSVYTSPIKALSNQKYRDLCAQYGEEGVGILTGDVSINNHAQVLVMTTEVYRNMALADPASIRDVGLLIMDEVHFMNDPERGTVWEESIIFSPPTVRFLALSATIPNAHDFADWIGSVHDHPVRVVTYDKRAVPLHHKCFVEGGRMFSYDDLSHFAGGGRGGRGGGRRGRRGPPTRAPSHLELVRWLVRNDKLPCLFFDLSRRDCEAKANAVADSFDPLPQRCIDELREIEAEYLRSDEISKTESADELVSMLEKGVAYHHAGLLPHLKRVVEVAFERDLIDVLFATETFAVGINYPARTVAFATLRKFDGTHFRHLNSKEYYQMAGRAGRRGMDTEGLAIAMVDLSRDDLREIRRLTRGDRIPITSRFQLSYNTILNLLSRHDRKQIGEILEKSFDSYLKRKRGERVDIWEQFQNRVAELREYGFLKGDALTDKGRFGTHIFTNELVTTELFFGDTWKTRSELDLATLAATVLYGDMRGWKVQKDTPRSPRIKKLAAELGSSRLLRENLDLNALLIAPTLEAWGMGAEFSETLKLCGMDEGDFVRFIRQVIDVLEQVRRASEEVEYRKKLELAIRMLDRGAVSVDFG